MSDFLVHLTNTEAELLSILDRCRVEPSGPFGAVWNQSHVPNQMSACFSEIPLDYLDRLMLRHGRFGVVLTTSVIRKAGGQRVWYLDRDGTLAQTFFQQVVQPPLFGSPFDQDDPIWKVTPFVDYVSDGGGGSTRHEFEWEREWRVVGGFNFLLASVEFLFAPQDRHDALRDRVTGWTRMLDGGWPIEKLQTYIAT